MAEESYLAIGNAPAAPFTKESNTLVLAASTEETLAVPSGYRMVLFTSTADFWATIGGTAAVPAADITNGSSAELNPVLRRVDDGDTISVISATDAIVHMAFFKDRSA